MARVTLKSTNVGTLYCDWTSNQDVANNRSTVKLSLVFVCANSYSIGPWSDVSGSYLGTTSMTFNGAIPNFSGTRTLATKTLTVNHNSDGTGSATIYWKWGVNSSWGGYVHPSGSFKITLPTIPRASQPTLSASSVQMGNQVTIYTNRASSAFTHTIVFTFGSYSATIATGVGDSFPYPTQLAMASYVPSATSGVGTFTVYTYNGSTLIGTKTVNITLTVPASIVPSISGASTTEANSAVTMGVFVQNQSRINVSITASGSYGSSITDYTSTFEGVTYKGQSFTIQSVPTSGNRTLTVTVKDSRQRTTTYTRTISVTAYAKPAISAFSAFRCDSSGAEDDGGSYVKFTYSFAITSLSNKNGRDVRIQYKLSTATSWTDLTAISGYSASGATYLSGAIFDPNHSYNVRLYVADTFSSTTSQADIETEAVTVDYLTGGQGMGLGKVAELENILDVAWTMWCRKQIKTLAGGGMTDLNGVSIEIFGPMPFIDFHYGSDGSTGEDFTHRIIASDPYNLTINGCGLSVEQAIRTYSGQVDFFTGSGLKQASVGTLGGNSIYLADWVNGQTTLLLAYDLSGNQRYLVLNPSYGAGSALYTFEDGYMYLGVSSARWRAVYATNGTIQTSDRNLKKDIKPIDEKYLKLFKDLKPVSYRRNEANSDRVHIGFISQDVEESLEKVGLTALDFAGFCKDIKQEKVAKGTQKVFVNDEEKEVTDYELRDVLDEDGNPEYIYSLRYEEFIALNTRMIQDLMQKVEDQQKIIDEQNKRLSALEAEIKAIKDLSGSFFDR